jgi:Leucine-rich repeat (LRR) protein
VLDTIKPIAYLKSLSLQSCGLTEIPKQVAEHTSLTALNLSNNLLTSLPNWDLSGLRKLDLSKNNLRQLFSVFRVNYWSIEWLSLQGNSDLEPLALLYECSKGHMIFQGKELHSLVPFLQEVDPHNDNHSISVYGGEPQFTYLAYSQLLLWSPNIHSIYLPRLDYILKFDLSEKAIEVTNTYFYIEKLIPHSRLVKME